MRKLSAIVLGLIYLSLSTGIVIGVHYCCNKRSGISFYASCSPKNPCCSKTSKKPCCHDEVTLVKLQNDHTPSAVAKPDGAKEMGKLAQVVVYTVAHEYASVGHEIEQDSGPPIAQDGLYLAYNNLRI